jgi:hypothetical protein
VITPAPMPPMLARLQPGTVAALAPAFLLVAHLSTEMAVLDWRCANDPDEPKLGAGWWA